MIVVCNKRRDRYIMENGFTAKIKDEDFHDATAKGQRFLLWKRMETIEQRLSVPTKKKVLVVSGLFGLMGGFVAMTIGSPVLFQRLLMMIF